MPPKKPRINSYFRVMGLACHEPSIRLDPGTPHPEPCCQSLLTSSIDPKPKDCDEFLVPPKGGLHGVVKKDPHADAWKFMPTLLALCSFLAGALRCRC